MATFFGEVLPLSSRAVEDDDEDLPIEDLELVTNNDGETEKAEFLFFAVGNAITFLEAYVLGLDGQNAESSPLISVKRRFPDGNDLFPSGLDYRRQEDVLARVYRAVSNPKVLVCLFPGQLYEENAARATNLIFQSPICASVEMVLALACVHITEFKHPNPVDNVRGPLLRHLASASLPEDKSPASVSRWLEQPNILSGVAAAALTECEVRNIPGLASVCYVDEDNSSAARALCPLLKCWPLNAVARVTENVEQNIDKLILKKLKHHGNLYL